MCVVPCVVGHVDVARLPAGSPPSPQESSDGFPSSASPDPPAGAAADSTSAAAGHAAAGTTPADPHAAATTAPTITHVGDTTTHTTHPRPPTGRAGSGAAAPGVCRESQRRPRHNPQNGQIGLPFVTTT